MFPSLQMDVTFFLLQSLQIVGMAVCCVQIPWHVPCGGVCYGDGNLLFVANDWHTALVPVYLQAYYRDNGYMNFARSILVIHNMAHQVRHFPCSKVCSNCEFFITTTNAKWEQSLGFQLNFSFCFKYLNQPYKGFVKDVVEIKHFRVKLIDTLMTISR